MSFKDTFYNICKENNVIGANIVVSDDKNVLENHSYGYANTTEYILSTENTIYRIASISKTVLAIGLMQLVEKGLIDLDEDISTYLGYPVRNPNFVNDVITVRMLTLQTSSILDGYDDENPEYDGIIKGYNGINGTYLPVTLKTLLTDKTSEYYTDLTFANYKPGSKYCYSNFGCGIVACIIEKVSNMTYFEYMEENVFKKLNINASYKAFRVKNSDLIATMYQRGKDKLYTTTSSPFVNSKLPIFALGDNYRGPAGGLFINMLDLSKIMRMFLNYGTIDGVKILSRETVEAMYQEQWCGLADDDYTAKATQMKLIKNNKSFVLRGHTGGAYGVRSYMYFNLEKKIGACFITNGIDSYPDSANTKKVFNSTISLWLDKYTKDTKKTVTIYDDHIILPERKIIHKNLFKGDYILGVALLDALDLIAIYDEDKQVLTFDDKLAITDVVVYGNDFYIKLTDTLDLLNISYRKENNYIVLSN